MTFQRDVGLLAGTAPIICVDNDHAVLLSGARGDRFHRTASKDKAFEPGHLLLLPKLHHFGRDRPFGPAQKSAYEAAEQSAAANHVGRTGHLVKPAENLP